MSYNPREVYTGVWAVLTENGEIITKVELV
jgi:hypothetical protein